MPVQLDNVEALADWLRERAQEFARPYVVALDGRSGAGKSMLAAGLAERLDAAVIAGDDFYAGGVAMRSDSPAERAATCIDWTRQRAVLEALRQGREACWRAFDWQAFDGRLEAAPTRLSPRPVIILEGVYATRPELADLVDMKLLLVVGDAVREARLLAREGDVGPWERQWHEAEAHYFTHTMPFDRFDVILDGSPAGRGPG